MRDADIPPRLRVLAMIHFSYADAEGKMFPSVETLRLAFTRDDDSPYNEKTIRRARSELVNLGWLTLVNKGVGRGKPSVYRLSFPALKPDIQASENRTLTPPENRTLDVRLSETGREKTSIGVVDGVEGGCPGGRGIS